MEDSQPAPLEIVQHAGGEYATRPAGPNYPKGGDPVHIASLFYVVDEGEEIVLAQICHDVSYCNDEDEMLRAEVVALEHLEKEFPDFWIISYCLSYYLM